MRVVFFGTPQFAVPSLAALLASAHQVVGVVTQPDKPRGRGQKVSDAPVKALALEHGLAVLQPARLSRDFEADFRALDAELGVVAAYGKILPEWLLAVPRLGMINVHASLLPRYRGAAPVHRAVMNGDTQTGVTIMRVVKALDAGPMMARVTRPIGSDESSEVVEQDLARMGAGRLVQVIDDLVRGKVNEEPQNDAEATYAPRLTKDEGLLDFSAAAITVHNRIRGLRPWPTAFTFLGGKRLVVHQARVSAASSGGVEPGTCVTASADVITVACGNGDAVDILLLQPEGRRTMTAREYLAGHGLLVGQKFG
jgi:methionyl-tRNA formyltransferase